MIQVNNVQLKHNGILADNSTKVTLYLPECTDEQHGDLIKLARLKTVGIIIVEPDRLIAIQELLQKIEELELIPDIPIREKGVRPLPLEDPLPMVTKLMSTGSPFDNIDVNGYEGEF